MDKIRTFSSRLQVVNDQHKRYGQRDRSVSMGDTKESRDKKGRDEEREQRKQELEGELEYESEAETRRENHEEEEAERELSEGE